jgi:hypothetical protein
MNRQEWKPIRFRLKTLFAFVSCVAVFCAAAVWVVRGKAFDSWRFPFLFSPSIAMMGVGIIGSLVFCLGALIAIATLVVRTRPRPLTSLVFFGCAVLVFVVDELAHLRLLLVMTGSAVAFLAETVVRRLPTSQIVAAVFAIAFTAGFYFLLLFGLAAGGV